MGRTVRQVSPKGILQFPWDFGMGRTVGLWCLCWDRGVLRRDITVPLSFPSHCPKETAGCLSFREGGFHPLVRLYFLKTLTKAWKPPSLNEALGRSGNINLHPILSVKVFCSSSMQQGNFKTEVTTQSTTFLYSKFRGGRRRFLQVISLGLSISHPCMCVFWGLHIRFPQCYVSIPRPIRLCWPNYIRILSDNLHTVGAGC